MHKQVLLADGDLATVELGVSLKWKITARGDCEGGRLHCKTLTGTRNWLERVVEAVEINCKKAKVANGGYRLLVGSEVVLALPIWWLEEARVSPTVCQSGCGAKVKILKIIGNL